MQIRLQQDPLKQVDNPQTEKEEKSQQTVGKGKERKRDSTGASPLSQSTSRPGEIVSPRILHVIITSWQKMSAFPFGLLFFRSPSFLHLQNINPQ